MTRKLFSILVPVALFTMSALAQNGAAAAPNTQSGSIKIGIISLRDVIVATNEGQRDLTALQSKFAPKQKELADLSKQIEADQTQLRNQGDKLSDDARAALIKKIESNQKVLQRQGEDAQADYDNQQNEIASRILQKLQDVIDKYAKQNGYAMILDASTQQSPILWATAQTNISKDIVEAYNAQSGIAAPVAPAGASATPNAPRPQTTRPAPTSTPKSAPPSTPKK